MKVNPSVTDRITLFRAAWQELAPTESFAGKTLAEFMTATETPLDLRADILKLEKQLEGKRTERDLADAAATRLLELVVNSVRGNPEFGSDSSLYRALGYVRRSERRSGLTRKKAGNASGANAA